MNSNRNKMRILIFLMVFFNLNISPGYCDTNNISSPSDRKAATMVAVQTLLLNKQNTTIPAAPIIGAREVQSTPVEQGTLFASPVAAWKIVPLTHPVPSEQLLANWLLETYCF